MRKIIGAALMGLVALASIASVTVSSVSATPVSPITPAIKHAARFCDSLPDISFDLQTQCVRVALTPARQGEKNGFPNGRVMVRECISEARAEDDGHVRTPAQRRHFLRNCLHWAGFSG